MSAQPSTSLVLMRDGFIVFFQPVAIPSATITRQPSIHSLHIVLNISTRVFSTSTTLSGKYSNHAPYGTNSRE